MWPPEPRGKHEAPGIRHRGINCGGLSALCSRAASGQNSYNRLLGRGYTISREHLACRF